MDPADLTHVLEAVAAGRLSTADAALRIRTEPYVDAGEFAKVDLHRRVRCGFPEVVFGQGKTRTPDRGHSADVDHQRAGRPGDARSSRRPRTT